MPMISTARRRSAKRFSWASGTGISLSSCFVVSARGLRRRQRGQDLVHLGLRTLGALLDVDVVGDRWHESSEDMGRSSSARAARDLADEPAGLRSCVPVG